MASIGIAGAGVLGRLLAWRLAHAGHAVSVYDAAPSPAPTWDGHGAAAHTAAGLLSPVAELDAADAGIAQRGWRSIACWHAITQRLPAPPCFAARGSLLLAHATDLPAARRVLARLGEAPALGLPAPRQLDADALATLEPALQAAHAWLLEGEGQIDTVAAMQALHDDAPGVRWHWSAPVEGTEPGRLWRSGSRHRYDCVFDVRGLGARPAVPQLRGVRGETVWLHAPGLRLQRPLRLLHPRHRVYVVPRPGDLLVLGATEIESEDRSPVSLRSAVELMTAAHSVLPALAEARIVRLDRHLRPALPDHQPLLDVRDGLVRINGLYRHGWLLAPALVEEALAALGLDG